METTSNLSVWNPNDQDVIGSLSEKIEFFTFVPALEAALKWNTVRKNNQKVELNFLGLKGQYYLKIFVILGNYAKKKSRCGKIHLDMAQLQIAE